MATAELNSSSLSNISDNFIPTLNQCRKEVNELFGEINTKLLERQNELLSDLDNAEKRYNDAKNAEEMEKKSEKMITDLKTTLEGMLNLMSKEAIEIQQTLINKIEYDRDSWKTKKESLSNISFKFNITELNHLNDCINQLGDITLSIAPSYTITNTSLILRDANNETDESKLDYPTDLALDEDDNIYISNKGNKSILVFTKDGDFIRQFGSEHLGFAEYTCINNNYLYISDWAFHSIRKFSLTGEFITKIASQGSKNDQFYRPHGIDYYNGLLYICDMDNNRIQVLNEELEWQKSIKHRKIKDPLAIKIKEDNIYFSNASSLNILSIEGSSIRTLPITFKWARYFILDNYENVIVSDYEDNSIIIISLVDNQIKHTISNNNTTGIALTKSNKIANVCSGPNTKLQLF